MSETVLEADEITSGYGPVSTVFDVSLTVRRGEIVALIGANGAGKTTVLRTLGGELKLTSGAVLLSGTKVNSPLHRRARSGLRYVTEERSVFTRLTVRQNLRVCKTDADEAVKAFPELAPLLDRPAGLLSGGEQQILTLARALAGNPVALLVDELSLGLAPLIVERLFLALKVAAQSGVGILLVEQQVENALRLADRAYVMRRGRIVLSGSADDLLSRSSEIEEHYLSGIGADSGEGRADEE